MNSNDAQWSPPSGGVQPGSFVAPGSQPPTENPGTPPAGAAATYPTIGAPTAPPSGPTGQPDTGRYYAYSAVQPGIIPLRPLSFSDIYNGIFRAMRDNPKVVFGLTILLATIASVIHAFLEMYVRDAFSVQLHQLFGSNPEGATGRDLLVTLTISPLTIGLVTVILSGVVVIAVSRSIIGHRITVKETWKMVLPRVPSLIGVSLLTTLITALPMGAAFLIVLSMIEERMSGGRIALVVVVAITLLILVFMASVYLTVKLLFGAAVVALEKLGPIAAIKRSWKLSKGSFWRITGHYVLIYFIVQTLSSLLMTPLMILMMLGMDFESTAVAVLPAWFTPVTAGITAVITVLFMSTLFTLIYTDIRMRREGLDITLMRAAGEHAAGNNK